MPLLEKINKKDSLSILGVLVGVIGLLYGVYIEFYFDQKPDLYFEIISNTSVLDLNEDVGKLEIIYDGQDIKENHRELRLITIRAINNSRNDISNGHFDSKIPFGIEIKNGKIVEKPELISASNEYLESYLNMTMDSLGSQVYITKVQIDGYQSFVFKILTITSVDILPEINSLGKIGYFGLTMPVISALPCHSEMGVICR